MPVLQQVASWAQPETEELMGRNSTYNSMSEDQRARLVADYGRGNTRLALYQLAKELGAKPSTILHLRYDSLATKEHIKKTARTNIVPTESDEECIALANERKCFRLQRLTGDRLAEAVNMVLRGEADYV